VNQSPGSLAGDPQNKPNHRIQKSWSSSLINTVKSCLLTAPWCFWLGCR
jgi:hypothetical protein